MPLVRMRAEKIIDDKYLIKTSSSIFQTVNYEQGIVSTFEKNALIVGLVKNETAPKLPIFHCISANNQVLMTLKFLATGSFLELLEMVSLQLKEL